MSRRGFAQLLGASVALATGSGCAREVPEKIVPYVRQPPEITPGIANVYATSSMLDGYATGLLVESHEGRPTKVEGNPEHPASLGAAGVFEQALVLQVYDPHRARGPRRLAEPVDWRVVLDRLAAPRGDHGAALRLLLEPTSSPLTHALLRRVQARHPASRVTFHAGTSDRASIEGVRAATGRPLQPQYDLRQAQVVVALDADPLGTMPFRLRHARHFAGRRRGEGVRLYAVETMLSVTGSMADNRLRCRGRDVACVAAALALALGGLPEGPARACAALASAVGEHERRWAQAVARDLRRRPRGTTLLMAGDRQPAGVHAVAIAMNDLLGNLGASGLPVARTPLAFTAPVIPEPIGGNEQDLVALVQEIQAGRIDTLLVVGGNPRYAAPADLDLSGALRRVPDSIYAGLYENETAQASRWFVPTAHELESWGDGRAYDGTLSLVQPLLQPLHDGRSSIELLAALAGDRQPDGRALVRDAFTKEQSVGWESSLALGFVAESAEPPVTARADMASVEKAVVGLHPQGGAKPASLEIGFHLSPTIHDGRFANNAWLQELPSPIGKLTWDNAALLSPATASGLDVQDGDQVELEAEGRRLRAPALIVPGHADRAVSLWLGYGREGAEGLASGVGVSAYRLRTRAAPWFGPGTARRVEGRRELALTQMHWAMLGRSTALRATRAELRGNPHLTDAHKGDVPSFFSGPPRPAGLGPPIPGTGPQWAMSIDTSICIGCNACMVACQAENNVLVVGPDGVRNSREMHWIRIDTYFNGPPDDPVVVHQPMLCQHCEHAPCEYVCPVNATVHSPDGLNEMIYNRCVGTRFCSNNCPYKVRRFNWFDWKDRQPANRGLIALQRNPDVTVRDRGVMEKCSYCVQRIRRAEIEARKQQREIATGEVVTACQQACPTEAIVFGSLREPDSEVGRLRRDPRSYEVLHDLGTRPRTTYLIRVDDPNEELA